MIAVRTRRALLLAAPLLYLAAIRPRLLGWGASREERRQLLPGDDLVSARWQTTRAIDISAPGLSRDGRNVLVGDRSVELDRHWRVDVIPYTGGPRRLVA